MEKIIKEIKLARGILIHNGKVLLAQDIRSGQGHYFLPGGNVETGESIQRTLVREWEEELGWKVKSAGFYGCLEHKWGFHRKQDNALIEVFEMNYLFRIEAGQYLNFDPQSKEEHLHFSWMPISDLSKIRLLPEPLKGLIPDISRLNSYGIWVSTLE